MTIKNPTPNDVGELKELWKEAFGDTDDFIDLFFSLAFSPEHSLCVYEGSSLAAGLYWFDAYLANEKVAYIYGVATKKTHRSKGFSTALLKEAHRQLKNSGYSAAILVPADAGLFGFYGRLGYRECCFIDLEKHTAKASRSVFEKISAEEYLTLRNSYLPQNSILFVNERLHFLAAITDFYKSDDFIFAKNKDGQELKIIEFFGDKAKISSVISALGFSEATVRAYGKEKAFAMYFQLTDNFNIFPEYLGFAFD